MEIPKDVYKAIADEIASDESPVGIDAKKTHVMILHQLRIMDERLRRIEAALEEG
jgi:cation transport regulator ChaC